MPTKRTLKLTPKWSRPDGKPSTDPRRLCHYASGPSDCLNDAMINAKHCIADPVSGARFYIYVCASCAGKLGWS